MESVEERFDLKCFRGHNATGACGYIECTNKSLICGDEECQCQQAHIHCLSIPSLKKLRGSLEKKGQNCHQLILEEVQKFLENHAKFINGELEYVRSLMSKKEFQLAGNENLLYLLMKEGKSDQIVPKLVADVMKSVQKQPVQDISARMEQTKRQVQKAEDQLKRVMKTVRKLTEVSSVALQTSINLADLRFSVELRSQNLSIINNQIVKLTNQTGSYYWTALLQSGLPRSKCKSCKVNFKINRVTHNQLMFGVCQLTPNFKITDPSIYSVIQHGSFTRWDNTVYLGKSEGHRKESMNITTYSVNDLVQVEYESETERVTVRNKTQNTQSVSYIKTDNNLPLYVGVILYIKDDEVQIVGGECKQ